MEEGGEGEMIVECEWVFGGVRGWVGGGEVGVLGECEWVFGEEGERGGGEVFTLRVEVGIVD